MEGERVGREINTATEIIGGAGGDGDAALKSWVDRPGSGREGTRAEITKAVLQAPECVASGTAPA